MSQQFQDRVEQLSTQFRAKYGLGPEDPWPDWALDRALVDHGFPHLTELPEDPPDHVPMGFDKRYLVAGPVWQRERAGHLLAHAILHGGRRCHSCRVW